MGAENNAVIVISNQNFRDEEFTDVRDALNEASIGMKIVALTPGECTGVNGTSVIADMTPDDVDASQFDAVVFIGGPGTEQILHDEKMQNLARVFVQNGKIVAAICWAVAILANAGVLRSKKATSWEGCKEDLTKGGATYTAEHVTVDGKIVTADGPDSAAEFGQRVALLIGQV